MFGNWKLGFVICLVIVSWLLVILAVGCGQPAAVTSTPAVGNITISGSLYTGTIGTASIKSAGVKILATPDTPIQNYSVVAVGKEDGKVYFPDSKTDDSGNFTISNLPSGEAFYLEVLDDDNKLVAPIAFGTSEGKAIMAITPEAQASIPLGKIAFSSSEGTAVPSTEPTAFLEENSQANVKSGKTLIPVGAGNFGKGSEAKLSGTYISTKVDGDVDGLPNFFDADNNGDGILDEFDGLSTKEGIALEEGTHAYVFTNLKVSFGSSNTFQNNYNEFNVAIGVIPETGEGLKSKTAKEVSVVRLVEGPSWVENAKVHGAPTAESAYPASGTYWKDTSPEAESSGILEGSYTFDLATELGSVNELFIGLCIRSIANDNAAQNIRFDKGW